MTPAPGLTVSKSPLREDAKADLAQSQAYYERVMEKLEYARREQELEEAAAMREIQNEMNMAISA